MGTFINSIVVLLLCSVFGAVTDEKSVSVNEGEALTLHTEVTDLQKSDKIRWRFEGGNGAKLIAEMTGGIIEYRDVDDGRFKDRLQILDLQTGDLIIKNMRHKHTGRYKLDFENKFGTTTKIFIVTVKDAPRVIDAEQSEVKSVSVTEGESVTLHTDVQTHRDDLILWRFGDKSVLIAKDDEENNKSSIYDDGIFRGRLKLDQSGSLTITDTKTTDAGVYKLQIINNRETKNKIFSVNVSERGLSAGEIAGIITAALLSALAVVYVGVIYYRHNNHQHLKLQVQEVTEFERNFVALDTGVELQSGDEIQWSFRDKVINTIKNNKISTDERLRDRLQVDPHTGSLIITSIRIEDAGLYKVKISSSSKVKTFLQLITGGGPSYSQFNVTVIVKREWDDSVTLHTGVTDLQSNDEIQWRFRETLIAQIKNNTISTHDDVLDERFRDRLKLNNRTGDLTIRDINSKHAGEYKLKIISSRGTSDSQFKVIVEERIRSVELGDSVTLYTGVTRIQQFWDFERGDVIQWRYGDEETPIAQITVGSEPSCDSSDERFRDKLKMDPQTGDLTITDITAELSGVYKAITSIRSRGTQYRKHKVVICENVDRGKSVTLHTESQIQDGNAIKWIFGDNICLVAGKKEGSNWPNYTEDERFGGRLEMNPETGDLTITDIRQTDDGLYTLQQKTNDRKISYKIFRVWVWGTEENESVEIPLMKEAEDIRGSYVLSSGTEENESKAEDIEMRPVPIIAV